MDVPTLMHNLKEEVTCSVCMQLYTDPKQLPCLHTFCLQCLNNVARTSKRNGTIRCPLCQREVAVPDCGTMESLPDCFYQKNLLDILAIKKCGNAKVTCGNCGEKNEKVSYCFHCGEFWCSVCLSGHNIIRANKDHRVLSLKDFEDKDFEDVLKRPAFCSKELHERQVLKFFCKMCNVPVCQTCVIVDHVGHNVEHLELTAKAAKENIIIQLDLAKSAGNTHTYLKEEMNEIENCTKATVEKIRNTTQSIIVKLQQFEQKLTSEVEDEGKAALEKLSVRSTAYQAQLTKYEETISQIEHLVNRGTAAEVVQLQSHVSKSLHELKIEPPCRNEGEERLILDFIPNHSFLEKIDDLGSTALGTLSCSATVASKCTVTAKCTAMVGEETKIEIVSRNSRGDQCYSSNDRVSSKFSLVETNCSRDFVWETYCSRDFVWKTVDEKNGKYIISFYSNLLGKVRAQFTINGEPIKQTLLLNIKGRNYEYVDVIHSDFYNPWGVAVNTSDDIYVTDLNNKKVQVWRDHEPFSRTFGRGVVYSPCGICTDSSGRIYVADRDLNKILLFNSQHKLCKKIGDEGGLKEPRGVSLDPEGNIIICNSGKSCVQLLSSEGDLLLTYDGRACGLQLPFDCTCHENNVYVSDFKGHSIKVFNDVGEFLFQFGEEGSGNGQFKSPTGLAVDKAGNLLVCDDYNHRVQVFTKDGRFLSKFGCYGDEMGQLNKPTGLAVCRNGDIVVAEFGNNRLQYFRN